MKKIVLVGLFFMFMHHVARPAVHGAHKALSFAYHVVV